MNTLLKIVLLVIAVIIAVKLLPIAIGLGGLFVGLIVGLAAMGVSALLGLVGLGLALAALTSPIWVPVLLIVGLIALIKRSSRPPPTLSA
jgi:hypothetical protein